jgi:UDP-glucose 4-epimerase
MKILVTGSAGYLGQALVKVFRQQGHVVTGLDVLASPETDVVASITDRTAVAQQLQGVNAVLHAATLHKPHVATHSRQDFVDTNISGTLTLLEQAVAAQVDAFIYTSTTSTFGDALTPPAGAPAAWITEDVPLVPKNIYGASKSAAEDLCQLFFRNHGLPCLVLRTSRFFPEPDDNPKQREVLDDSNLKVVELLYRRADIHDVVSAHSAALACARRIGFGKFIISATSPFDGQDLSLLRGHTSMVLRRKVPAFEAVFKARGWALLEDIDRVYVNQKARQELGWQPEYDFARAMDDLGQGRDTRSPLARSLIFRGYHQGQHADGLYPVET